MKTSLASILCSCLFLVACGSDDGGSGVDESKAITDLSESEVSAFCEWAIEVQGGEGFTENCGDFTYEVGTVAECRVDYANIPAACNTITVGEMEACVEAFGQDPCGAFSNQVCAEYFDCYLGAQ